MADRHVPAQSTEAAHHQLSVSGRIGSLDIQFHAAFTSRWTVLFGPSGCGKSTLLRAICGLTDLRVDLRRHTAGTWEVLEDQIRSTAPEARHIAYAPQQAVLFPHLTAFENVAFAASVRPRSKSTQSLVPQAMHLLHLESLAHRLPRQLSGGERQRVSLARALAVPDARLVLLDEPFAGIDRVLRDDLLPRIQAWLTERHLPAISVTHDVDETLLLAADVIRLQDGHILAHGPASAVLADEVARLLQTLGTAVSSSGQ